MAEQVTLETRGSQTGRLAPLRVAPGDVPRRYSIPPVAEPGLLSPERYRMRAGTEPRPFTLQPWTRPSGPTLRPFLRVVSRNDAPCAIGCERPTLRLVVRNDDLPPHAPQPPVAPERDAGERPLVSLHDAPAG
jgi:hypothetical protein